MKNLISILRKIAFLWYFFEILLKKPPSDFRRNFQILYQNFFYSIVPFKADDRVEYAKERFYKVVGSSLNPEGLIQGLKGKDIKIASSIEGEIPENEIVVRVSQRGGALLVRHFFSHQTQSNYEKDINQYPIHRADSLPIEVPLYANE